jgi:protein-disulfide isomerase
MNASRWSNTLAIPVSKTRDHIQGPETAPVTLLEYGDYECPYCGAAHPIVRAIREEMGSQLRFVYRHFPLNTVHMHAQQAAEAAEEAGAFRRFWQMHDTLYEHQQALDDDDLLRYAAGLNLNIAAFRADLSRHIHLPKVREDFMSGVHSGVSGTPAFYINGRRFDASWDLETLFDAVQAAARAES